MVWPRMATYRAQASDGVIKQKADFDPMRHKASFSTMSSPMDDPRHYVYLHASLCAICSSKAVSEIEIAISRELPQSRYGRLH